MSIRRIYDEWKDWRSFTKLTLEERAIVVYSEDAGSWPHLGPLVDGLLERHDGVVCYVTSDPSDPRLDGYHPNLRGFCVGLGAARTYFFLSLKANVLLMTMPDLQTFHIKRSNVHPVHYAYVFHSLASTHMIYRPGAFDHFDTILCGGPHHLKEIRETERVYKLPPKNLVEYGYGKVDSIRRDAPKRPMPAADPIKVLVAPSWGPQGLIETRGAELARVLLDAGFDVTFRPHPMTGKKSPQSIKALNKLFGGDDRFLLDVDMSSRQSLLRSDIMISDWSGAALEYSFGLERPVIFIEVPRKVNNADYQKIPCEPLEVSIRNQLGVVLPADELGKAPEAIRRLCDDPEVFSTRIRKVLISTLFNVGVSREVGVDALLSILDRLRKTKTA